MTTEMLYENLPKWRLWANALEYELAQVWYGVKQLDTASLWKKLERTLFAYAAYLDIPEEDFAKCVAESERSFFDAHGVDIEQSPPIQRLQWIANRCLLEHQRSSFYNDPQIYDILIAYELIYALHKAGVRYYYRYSVQFKNIGYYANRPLP